MARAISCDEEQVHVLTCDRGLPVSEQTRWFYRPLSADAYYAAQDGMVQVEQAAPRKGFRQRKGGEAVSRTLVLSGTHELNILLKGITRVENFLDKHGVQQVWPVDGGHAAKVAFLSKMQPDWRTELANAIAGSGELEEDEVGNSASPSGSPAPGTAGSASDRPTSGTAATAA
jgi:hypothetical protein